jgi:hypothetical protein
VAYSHRHSNKIFTPVLLVYVHPSPTMDSGDLFSFLDGLPAENVGDQDDQMDLDVPQTSSKKRKATPSKSPPFKEGRPDAVDDESTRKKPRMASPAPVVVDEFETEAKREVEASAGLTGSKVEAGSRLELRHQVCPVFCIVAAIYQQLPIRSATKSRYLPGITTFQYRNIFHLLSLLESINLLWILFKKSLFTPFNGMRAFSCRLILVLGRLW